MIFVDFSVQRHGHEFMTEGAWAGDNEDSGVLQYFYLCY